MCLQSKAACALHLGWARVQRMRLDLEVVQVCLHEQYLLRQLTVLHDRMGRRASLLAMALNPTTDHTPAEALALTAGAREEAILERARLDTSAAERAAAAALRDDASFDRPQCTGGSLHLPRRHWR